MHMIHGYPLLMGCVAPHAIERFLAENPVQWSGGKAWSGKDAQVNGAGDKIYTPTLVMELFFNLLADNKGLFTQQMLYDYCIARWADNQGYIKNKPEEEPFRICNWLKQLDDEGLRGLKAKIFRNYYVAGVVTLHAQSLLAQSGLWDGVWIDTQSDGNERYDLVLQYKGKNVYVGLTCSTDSGLSVIERKTGNATVRVYYVVLPCPSDTHKFGPGRLHLHKLSDFERLIPRDLAGLYLEMIKGTFTPHSAHLSRHLYG